MAELDLVDAFEKTALSLVDFTYKFALTWRDLWRRPSDVLDRVRRSLPLPGEPPAEDSGLAPPVAFAALNVLVAQLVLQLSVSQVSANEHGSHDEIMRAIGQIGAVGFIVSVCVGLLILSLLIFLWCSRGRTLVEMRRAFSAAAYMTMTLPLTALNGVLTGASGLALQIVSWVVIFIPVVAWLLNWAKIMRPCLFGPIKPRRALFYAMVLALIGAIVLFITMPGRTNRDHLIRAQKALTVWEAQWNQSPLKPETWEAANGSRPGHDALDEIDFAGKEWTPTWELRAGTAATTADVHLVWAKFYLLNPQRAPDTYTEAIIATMQEIRGRLHAFLDTNTAMRAPLQINGRATTLEQELPRASEVRIWRARLKETTPTFPPGRGLPLLYGADIDASLRAVESLATSQ